MGREVISSCFHVSSPFLMFDAIAANGQWHLKLWIHLIQIHPSCTCWTEKIKKSANAICVFQPKRLIRQEI